MNKKGKIKYGMNIDIVFTMMFTDEKLCLKLINTLLPELHITHVKIDTQHEVNIPVVKRGSRFDVFATDEKGAAYDIEMQVEDEHNLDKRLRFYQSKIDSQMLNKGQKINDIKNSYIIFLCYFDPFGANKMQYKFSEMVEDSNPKITFKPGFTFVVVNSKGSKKNMSDDIIGLTKVMNHQYDDKSSNFSQLLVNKLEEINENPERVKEIMLYEQKLEDERLKGYNEGVNQTADKFIKVIVTNLKKKGMSKDQILKNLKAYQLDMDEQNLLKLIDRYY